MARSISEKGLVRPEPKWSQASLNTRLNIGFALAFLAVTFLFGGASRADVLGQGVVRLAAILMIAAGIVQLDREGWRRVRLPAALALAATAVILAQLVPLPSGLWESLPGRSIFAQALALAGVPATWRPLSLTPDLTLNTLLAMLPPLAAIAGMALVKPQWHPLMLPVLLAGIAASALVGIVQISTGAPYFYRVTNYGSAVGFFANRNHEALLLALAIPLLAGFASAGGSRTLVAARTWLAVCAATAIFPLLLVTGSRGGLLLGVIGCALGGVILYGARHLRPRSHRLPRAHRWLIAAVATSVVVVAAILFRYFARDIAFQRLIGADVTTVRGDFLPIFMRMAADFFPAGAGFGSFDTLFRIYEPHSALDQTYLNHAHNDLAQVIIEGGAPALAVLLVFAGWYLARCVMLWVRPVADGLHLLGRVGSAIVALILLHSLVDYPLRTPLISVIFVIACCWMAAPRLRASDDVRLSRPASSVIASAPGR